jgi:hypothetical protein
MVAAAAINRQETVHQHAVQRQDGFTIKGIAPDFSRPLGAPISGSGWATPMVNWTTTSTSHIYDAASVLSST